VSDELPVPSPSSERPELRASDAEREQTAEMLRNAMGEGRLTVEEHGAPVIRIRTVSIMGG
jgi:Domain of unknown function (DUF1707)